MTITIFTHSHVAPRLNWPARVLTFSIYRSYGAKAAETAILIKFSSGQSTRAQCAVERDALRSRGSNLSQGASTIKDYLK